MALTFEGLFGTFEGNTLTVKILETRLQMFKRRISKGIDEVSSGCSSQRSVSGERKTINAVTSAIAQCYDYTFV